jgi:hypothetical protein
MAINIKDSFYFKHFSITPLKKMQLSLRELKLIFEEGKIYNRGSGHLLLVMYEICREITIDLS